MIQGVVQKINIKPWGGKNLYSFFIKGQDGMFSLGEHPPVFKEGDSIKFETKQVGKYTNAVSVVPWDGTGVVSDTPVAQVARKAYTTPYNKQGGKSTEEKDYWAKKDANQEIVQKRIEIQAGRNAAIEAAKFLIEKEFVKTPTKQADKYDAYLALVNQLTDEFLKNTSSRLGLEASSESGSTGKDSPEVAKSNTEQGSWE